MYDDSSNETYILSFDQRNWKVDKLFFYIFECIKNKGSTLEVLQSQLENKYGLSITINDLYLIIEDFFKKHGLLEGYKSKFFTKKGKIVFTKLPLIPTKVLNYFSLFEFLLNFKLILAVSIASLFFTTYILWFYIDFSLIKNFFNLGIVGSLITILLIIIFNLFHELGYALATTKFKVLPGRICLGFYYIIPILFTDSTNVWKLRKGKRFFINFTGIYFQGFALILAFLFNVLFLQNVYLDIAIIISSLLLVKRFYSFIKFDEYLILSHFLGVKNVFEAALKVWEDFLLYILFQERSKNNFRSSTKLFIYISSVLTTLFIAIFTRLSLLLAYACLKQFYNNGIELYRNKTSYLEPDWYLITEFIINNLIVLFTFVFIIKIIIFSFKFILNKWKMVKKCI